MFLHRIQRSPDVDAFYYPNKDEEWQTLKWKAVGERVEAISGALCQLNLQNEERCAIFSNTCVEWILIDLGILCAGGATTTIYPSSTPEEASYILSDSGTKFVFAEDDDQVKKLITIRDQIPQVEKVIVINGASGHDGFVLSLGEFEKSGEAWNKENPDAFLERIKSQKPEHLATLIYTSGTTGLPKGVELTHDCWVFEAEAMDKLGIFSSTDKQYLWLPLAHSFGKVLAVSVIRIGIPTAIDGRIDKIIENLETVQPTFIAAVPRIFEKMYNKAIAKAKANGESSLKYKIFRWALSIGHIVSGLKQKNIEPTGLLRLRYGVAERLVFNKLRKKFGGQLKFFVSGSAPLSNDIASFFHAAGILILEGYGLTESSAASFVNLPNNFKFGTVGKALPGVDLKLIPIPSKEGEEPKKEILLSGRGIMRGYYRLPEVSTDTIHIDENGKTWLRTGDAGELDEDGFLKITDRIKNLIKTSGGKYVAPQKLEGKFKSLCQFASQAIVHGNKRNFCSMLITLDEDQLKEWAEDAGLHNLSYRELTEHSGVNQVIQTYVDALNEPLMSYETIKKFAILPSDFTIEGGELTPSMKVKRKFVEQKYKEVLDSFYSDSLQSI